MTRRAGLGLRVKTARAIGVVLAGDTGTPDLVWRGELKLSDPDVPESFQPYHAGLGLTPDQARCVVEPACAAVRQASRRALHALLDDLAKRDVRIAAAALVRSTDTDPDTIRQPHMHAHAAEGRLFYDAVGAAAEAARIPVHGLLHARVHAESAHALGRAEAELRGHLAVLGKSAGAPWRADEKAACAAAWLALGRP